MEVRFGSVATHRYPISKNMNWIQDHGINFLKSLGLSTYKGEFYFASTLAPGRILAHGVHALHRPQQPDPDLYNVHERKRKVAFQVEDIDNSSSCCGISRAPGQTFHEGRFVYVDLNRPVDGNTNRIRPRIRFDHLDQFCCKCALNAIF